MTDTTISRSFKRDKLASLKDEVKEFHPVLDKIFPQLPRVSHVEYTHGPNEKGADFVLTRNDDAICDVEYIGMIVKVGNISVSLTSIFDQIDDCESNRIILNGKKKISLDEIWIITNGNITGRAKEKINDRYKLRKIKFINRDNIIKWIDKYLPNFWVSVSLEIGSYLRALNGSILEMDTALSLLPAGIEPFYIDQEIRKIKHDYTKKKRNTTRLVDLIERQTVTIIEGGPGAGKSQMVRNAISYFCSPEVYSEKQFLPIYVSYQDFRHSFNCDFNKLVDKKFDSKLQNEIFNESSVTKIFFIDGFDESVEVGRDVNAEIEKMYNQVEENTDSKVIVTTRPLDFIDYKETLPSNTSAYEIVPFGLEKTIQFFEKICSRVQIADRIYEDLKKSDLFKQLPRNPISAILLATLLAENSQDLPANLTDIYRKYTELMLGRWDIDKGLKSDQEYEVGKNILTHLAYFFIENDLSSVSCADALSHFDNYLDDRNLEINSSDIFDNIVSRSGILQKNTDQNTIYFKHRSFAEFFYAQYKVFHYDKSFLNKNAFTPTWRNIYFFYLGINKDCEYALDSLLSIEILEPFEKFYRVINSADYLLAAYTTPYRVIEKYLPILIQDYKDLYLQIINDEIDTPFQDMPEIMILEFFQVIINNAYSYSFFIKGFDNTILEIGADDKLSDEEKAYALFFISVIYRSLDLDNPFDNLLDTMKGKIPLPLRFGLYYESKYVRKPSKMLKKVEKKLKKDMKRQFKLKQYAKKLHELPLKKSKKKSINQDTTKK